MATGPAFLTTWRRTLPRRWRGLLVPYGQALGVFGAGYAGTTALLTPWALGRWWQFWVPVVAGFGACWWLWQPWALLARNTKGETRRAPLLIVWSLLIALGWNLRQYLYYRLGEVRDLRSVRDLAQPGKAVFFRLHGPFYPDKTHLGRYLTRQVTKQKDGSLRYVAAGYYACPLLATAADTATRGLGPAAWLSYSDAEVLGYNLAPGELNWRAANFAARADARLDSANFGAFTYLERTEHPAAELYLAVAASRLPQGTGLLLRPVRAPFAARGIAARRVVLWLAVGGSAFVGLLLLLMPLRPADAHA